jgi:hypothetical protein
LLRRARLELRRLWDAKGHAGIEARIFGSPHIGATTRESWEAMRGSGMRGIEEAYEPQPGVYPFD